LLRDDIRFIDLMMNRVDKSDFKAVLMQYLQEWHQGMSESENESHMQNLGRKKANTWLREYVEKNKASYW
jgi:hypothetical protein